MMMGPRMLTFLFGRRWILLVVAWTAIIHTTEVAAWLSFGHRASSNQHQSVSGRLLRRGCSRFQTTRNSCLLLPDGSSPLVSLKAASLRSLPENYQETGNGLISQAAEECGAHQDQIGIEWKPSKIVVTVRAESVFVSAEEEEEEGFEEEDLDELYLLDDDGIIAGRDEDVAEEGTGPGTSGGVGVDMTQIARTINRLLDENMPEILETHEIEVTTPGASDDLLSNPTVMFESYRGFPVVAEYQNPKTNKKQFIEGKLVERNDTVTIVNVKGRMRKLINENLLSVKLPKAKKEKGAR